MFKKLSTLATTFIFTIGISGFAHAQQQAQPMGQAQQASVSAEAQKKFPKVKAKVDRMSKKYANKLNKVKDPAKAKSIQMEYREKVTTLITKNGLTLQEYTQLSGM